MLSIQTNVNSLVAQQNLSVTSLFQSKTIAQLTSGYRINQSGDDAAGLAVANKFRSTVAELTQGVANGNDATAQLQIMDGGMSNISMILDRLKTLATQSASGTFTGNRSTVNAEFQNDLAEIDRQAQSIGLNSGGVFAKNLDVYLGAGSGSQSLQNGVVTLGLTASSVDSQALGMKGMEAVGGGGSATDLGTGASSVASIVADATNTSSEAAPGYATFTFSGAGYSDAGKVKVQVNMSSVSDTASLVTALNNAISGAGSGSPQGLAFGRAGVVASVVTDATGQHLGFTSSTSAFQVQAGDKMSNAMLGNFKDITTNSEGADIKTTVTGGTTDLVGTTFAPGAAVTVRIQGSGLASPVDLTIATGGLVGAAITSLQGQVSSNAQLSAAGISLSVVSNQLVFTSATGESLGVMATGDKTNQLGLGSFTRSASVSAVDYNSIIGATNYAAAGTATNENASLQISINGAAATNLSVSLTDVTLGATKATTTTTTALSAANIDALNGKVLTVSVDGISASTAAFVGGTAAAITGSGNVFAGSTTITAASASNTVGISSMVDHDWAAAGAHFDVTVNGGPTQTIYLTKAFAVATDKATFAADLNAQLTGATASFVADTLKITATAAGAGSVVIAAGAGGSVADIGATFTTNAGANGNNQLLVSSNATSSNVTPTLVSLTAGTYTGAQMVVEMNARLFAAGLNDAATPTSGVIASLSGNNLSLSASSVGSSSWVTVAAPVLGAASTALVAGATGLSAGTSLGTDASAASILNALQTAINTAVAGTGTNAGATVSLDGSNRLVITNNNAGAGHTTTALSGTGTTGSGGPLAAGTANVGTDLTGAQLASALNQQLTTGVLSKAQLTASYSAGALTIASGNSTDFRVNSGIVNTAIITGTGNLATAGNAWTGSPASFQISVDGAAFSADIALSANQATAPLALAYIQAQMVAAGISATAAGGAHATMNGSNQLVITSNTVGAGASIQVQKGTLNANALTGLGMGTLKHSADADIGLGVSGSNFTQTLANVAPKNFVIDAGGASQALTTLTNPTSALAFNALLYGNDSQAITLSANDANGNQQSTTITLKNIATGATGDNTAGRNIDEAVSFINRQLQASNNATLQKIVAVKQNVGNTDKINFISSLASFNVGVGSTANGAAGTGDGINFGVSTNVAAGVVGAGANMTVDTKLGAQAAVLAIGVAIAQLGSAQAAVGKGQNQLAYAVNLAQSQITNFSAAESQIRDANVAQQAANLSKAQVLSQASIAAMAQANSAPQAVLSLLRG